MPNTNDVIVSVTYGHAYAGHAGEFNNPKIRAAFEAFVGQLIL